MEKTTIHTEQFLVVSLDKSTGVFCIPSRPVIYTEYFTALHEAQRLAETYESKRFIVLGVAAVAQSKNIAAVVTGYSI